MDSKYRLRRCNPIYLAFAWILCPCVSTLVFAERPSESKLPARKQFPGASSLSGAEADIRVLAPESTLPGSKKLVLETKIVSDDKSVGSNSNSKDAQSDGNSSDLKDKNSIPSETELPPVETAPPTIVDAPQQSIANQGNEAGDTARVQTRGDEIEAMLYKEEGETTPWARLINSGHTSAVSSLSFSPDGGTLYSAGRDKLIHIWSERDNQWSRTNLARWQVSRGMGGSSGSIKTILATEDFLFIGGSGVKTDREIGLLERNTLNVFSPLVEPGSVNTDTERIVALPSKDLTRVVATDLRGGVVLWELDRAVGKWSPKRIRDCGKVFHTHAPIAVLNASKIAVPLYEEVNNKATWKLELVSVPEGRSEKKLSYELGDLPGDIVVASYIETFEQQTKRKLNSNEKKVVTTGVIPPSGSTCISIASSPSGEYVASLDDMNWLAVWHSEKGLVFKSSPREWVVVNNQPIDQSQVELTSLAWSALNNTFYVGVFDGKTSKASLQSWTLSADGTFRMSKSVELAKPIMKIAVSNNWIALDSGSQILIVNPKDLSVQQPPLGVNDIRTARKIQWSSNKQEYAWKWNDADGTETAMGIRNIDDNSPRLQILDKSGFNWEPIKVDAGYELPAYDQERKNIYLALPTRGKLPLFTTDRSVLDNYGEIWAKTWVLDRESKPVGIAVAFQHVIGIHVFGFPNGDSKEFPLLRVFRGHEDIISSMDCSPDGRYLISAGRDRKIDIWPLKAWDASRIAELDPISKWGVITTLNEGSLDIDEVSPEGPMYSRGLRAGDRIVKLAWTELNPATNKVEPKSTEDVREISRRLASADFFLAYAFWTKRGDADSARFRRACQWEPILEIVTNSNKEWAAWTPLGFYDASINGDQLFGWQLNRGPDKRPDFFEAARFRQSLERPDVIGKLLQAGNIAAAFDNIAAKIPGGPERALALNIGLQPDIRILTPSAQTAIDGNRTRIRAEVNLTTGQSIGNATAFINGVIATGPKFIGPLEGERSSFDKLKRTFTLEWDAAIPSDPKLKVQVFVATKERNSGMAELLVERTRNSLSKPILPNVHVLSSGVSEYRDPALNLVKPSENASEVADRFTSNSIHNPFPRALVLTDKMVTPTAWKSAVSGMADQLRDNVSPDDLIVIYLTGHGVVDPETDQYYFVTSHAIASDVRARRYEDCLTLKDLADLRHVSCRKLIILDTCHSGAAQQQEASRLKQAIRTLQDDQFFVMTASQGNQLAFENAFTEPLKEALDGKADSNNDKLVSLQETFKYVKEKMMAREKPQLPTFGPSSLIELIDLPIVRSSSSQNLTKKLTRSFIDPISAQTR